jgi:hypothetical protein
MHHFPGFIMRRRPSQFFMEQAAISCEGAASARERIERLVGELRGDLPESRIVA